MHIKPLFQIGYGQQQLYIACQASEKWKQTT
jgi:hypothetical protein